MDGVILLGVCFPKQAGRTEVSRTNTPSRAQHGTNAHNSSIYTLCEQWYRWVLFCALQVFVMVPVMSGDMWVTYAIHELFYSSRIWVQDGLGHYSKESRIEHPRSSNRLMMHPSPGQAASVAVGVPHSGRSSLQSFLPEAVVLRTCVDWNLPSLSKTTGSNVPFLSNLNCLLC